MPDPMGMTEERRVKYTTELLVFLYRGVGTADSLIPGKIFAAIGSLFDGSFRKRKTVTYCVHDGTSGPFVSTEGVFLMVAGEHDVNLYAPATQARWSCWVRDELGRLVPTEGV